MKPESQVSHVIKTIEQQETTTQEEIGMLAEESWISTLVPEMPDHPSLAYRFAGWNGFDGSKQMIMAVRNENGEYTCLDSACFDHVCPSWFA